MKKFIALLFVLSALFLAAECKPFPDDKSWQEKGDEMLQNMKQKTQEIMDNMKEYVNKAMDSARTKWQEFVDSPTPAPGESQDWMSVGKNMMNNIMGTTPASLPETTEN